MIINHFRIGRGNKSNYQLNFFSLQLILNEIGPWTEQRRRFIFGFNFFFKFQFKFQFESSIQSSNWFSRTYMLWEEKTPSSRIVRLTSTIHLAENGLVINCAVFLSFFCQTYKKRKSAKVFFWRKYTQAHDHEWLTFFFMKPQYSIYHYYGNCIKWMISQSLFFSPSYYSNCFEYLEHAVSKCALMCIYVKQLVAEITKKKEKNKLNNQTSQ